MSDERCELFFFREAVRAGLAQPATERDPKKLADSPIPAFLCLDTAARAKTTGIRELGVPISGIWRLGFKTDEA